ELSADHPRRQLEVFDRLSWVLNACRNRLVLINCLPQDIMYRIFSIVLELENIHRLEPNVDSKAFVDQRGRLRLVSRIWNSFLVSTPGFWTVVDIQAPNPKILDRRLQLAQQGELCIAHRPIWSPSGEYQQLATVLSAYLDRIRTLRLGSEEFTTALIQSSFPALRTLEMRNHWQEFGLAQDRFPQLCDLRISRCLLPQDAMPLKTLRILHLNDIWSNNLNEIIDFLKICPEIEELTISQSEDQSMWISGPSTTVRLEKLRRLELQILETRHLLHIFRFAKIPNFKQVIFTIPAETGPFIESDLQEILDTLQTSSFRSSSMELSVFGDAVTCATQDGQLVKVRIPERLSSVSPAEHCADIFLDRLKPETLRLAVELEDQKRLRRLKQVLQQNNVIELRVRLGYDPLRLSRAVTDYLAHFCEESGEHTEEKMGSELGLPLPSLQALAFENGTVDIPQLLRMVASRLNGRGVASARIQEIMLVKCDTTQWPDFSSRFRDLGVDLTLQ
ncbi:hypothetical protein FS837_005640, partial [Tulasnella sp. UAMH 9824]